MKKEKEFTHLREQLAEQRRALPWEKVDKEYAFETQQGKQTLANLFGDKSQLVIYQFMFGPAYEAGCPVCSSIADNINPNVPHVNARDVTMICASRAPLEKLQGYKRRMGWSFDWVSTHGSDFNFDFGFS